jgi:hypothetical protein
MIRSKAQIRVFLNSEKLKTESKLRERERSEMRSINPVWAKKVEERNKDDDKLQQRHKLHSITQNKVYEMLTKKTEEQVKRSFQLPH